MLPLSYPDSKNPWQSPELWASAWAELQKCCSPALHSPALQWVHIHPQTQSILKEDAIQLLRLRHPSCPAPHWVLVVLGFGHLPLWLWVPTLLFLLYLMLINLDNISYWMQDLYIKFTDLSKLLDIFFLIKLLPDVLSKSKNIFSEQLNIQIW